MKDKIFGVLQRVGRSFMLPIIFAMGVAIGMAKKEKEVAALAAAIAFFIMHASISALIEISGGVESMLSGATASVCGITATLANEG